MAVVRILKSLTRIHENGDDGIEFGQTHVDHHVCEHTQKASKEGLFLYFTIDRVEASTKVSGRIQSRFDDCKSQHSKRSQRVHSKSQFD
jgi:hypothetical protein